MRLLQTDGLPEGDRGPRGGRRLAGQPFLSRVSVPEAAVPGPGSEKVPCPVLVQSSLPPKVTAS